MASSLGLTAYRALTRRNTSKPYTSAQNRPSGELLWIHLPQPDKLHILIDFCKRFQQHRHDLSIIITTQEQHPSPSENIWITQTPGEHPREVIAFLDHWRPDVGLWLWGDLRPNLIFEANKRDVPMFMADADQKGFGNRRDRWLPEVARDCLISFQKILTRSEQSFERLLKIMRQESNLELGAPLQAGGQVLSYSESDFDDISTCLKGRPIWLAASVQPEEIHIVLSAHRQAARMSHRLMLILNPAKESQAEACKAALKEDGLRFAHWDDGEMPDDNTQVLLVSAQDELGLWYRVAPLGFLGSSLIPCDQDLDPFRAATHGCSILYGPNVPKYIDNYSRLARAGAARIINDAETLGMAVARLISPDQAASMAMAGWDVVSEGAISTDRLIQLLNDSFDELEERDR